MITWAIGTRLDPYVLISPIGTGGMGEAWKARDTRLDGVVAIKRQSRLREKRWIRVAMSSASVQSHMKCFRDTGLTECGQ